MAVRFFIFILCSRSIIDVGCWLFKDLVFLGALLYLPFLPSDREDLSQGLAQKVWTLTMAVFIVLHVSAATLKH